jgi:undecaprenyl-diphosphatase
MIDFLIRLDIDLFLLINGWRSAWADVFFWWVSDKYIWAPFYALLLFLMIRKNMKYWWLVLLMVPLLVTLTDQSSVQLFKNVCHRFRPCHNPELEGLVQIVNGKCGGSWGFVSSHAANAFGVAMFSWLMLRKHIKYMFWPLLIGYAALIAYSRVYLGVHYPADVTVGAILGMLLGFGVYKLFEFLSTRVLVKSN